MQIDEISEGNCLVHEAKVRYGTTVIAAENSDVPEAPVPVPVAVAVTTEPGVSEPRKVLIECRVTAGVGGDIHRTDPCLALAETGRIGSRTGEEIDPVGFVGNAVKAALDYSLAVRRSKNGVILELVRAVIAIPWIVGSNTKPVLATAFEIDAELVIREDRISVEVVSESRVIEDMDTSVESSVFR